MCLFSIGNPQKKQEAQRYFLFLYVEHLSFSQFCKIFLLAPYKILFMKYDNRFVIAQTVFKGKRG